MWMMRAFRVLAIVALAATAWSPLPAVAQDKSLRGVALVIGESDYDQLDDLDNPENDARAMDDLLGALGFKVQRVLDGTGEDLRDEFESFVAKASRADVALVYYSGHGIEVAGENFLVPTDADLTTPAAAGETIVSVAALLDELARTVPVTIVLLDACRTNSFPTGTMVQLPGSDMAVPVDPVGLEALRGPTPIARQDASPDTLGMVIGFAASPGQPALDGEPGGNSPYAAALIKHFSAGGYSFGDLMTMVAQEVYLKTRARQLPWTNSSLTRVLSFGKAVPVVDEDQRAISDERRQLLLAIASEPPDTRQFIETMAARENVPLDQLYGMLEVLGVDTVNDTSLQQKLEQGAEELRKLMSSAPGAVKSDVELLRLADLATQAQQEGAMALALKYRAQASARADELRAVVDANEAAVKADRMQIGTTYAEHAQTALLNFDYATAAQKYGEAFIQVERWDEDQARSYKWSQADALSNYGRLKGDNDAFRASIVAYREALDLLSKEEMPQDWSAISNNMAGVYEQLGERGTGTADLEAAVEIFHQVLEIETREDDPMDWALAQTNLGGTLTKIGERTHDEGKLMEGIAAFRLALQVRTFESDRYSWAMTQYNMGTALTILGTRSQNKDRLAEGIDALRAAATGFDRGSWPWEWAMSQYVLAANLMSRAVGREPEDAKADLREAIGALNASLEERTREKWPLDWAFSNAILGSAYEYLAGFDSSVSLYGDAERHYQLALGEMTRERSTVQWAYVMVQVGSVETSLGALTADADKVRSAIEALTSAQFIYTPDAMPHEWAYSEGRRGAAFLELARLTRSVEDVEHARDAFAAARDRYAVLGNSQTFEYELGQVDELMAQLSAEASP